MNELKDLETRLESWTPRRPSWRVKSRAWAAGMAAVGAGKSVAAMGPEFSSLRLSWLAPATMALLLSCVLFNQRTSGVYVSSDSGPLVAAAMSNQGAATWLPGSFQREQNSLPAVNFGWTNERISNSSVTSIFRARGTH